MSSPTSTSTSTSTSPATRPAMFENLEGRTLFSITTAVEVVKIPGPTDAVVTAATNPAGNAVPGQSSVVVLSNRDAKAFK
jgi:hypothetical protein